MTTFHYLYSNPSIVNSKLFNNDLMNFLDNKLNRLSCS